MFWDPSKVRQRVVQAFRNKASVVVSTPAELPPPSENIGKIAECNGRFYISNGEAWVKNVVEE